MAKGPLGQGRLTNSFFNKTKSTKRVSKLYGPKKGSTPPGRIGRRKGI